jgi:ribosomal protein S27AE
LDPTNAAARRGLAVLKGKIDLAKLIPEGSEPVTAAASEEIRVETKVFHCPRCGGKMVFSAAKGQLTCVYCGYIEEGHDNTVQPEDALSSLTGKAEQPLDFVMPTISGHRWAYSRQVVSCPQCGALSMLSPGDKALECPYCGSNQVVQTSPEQELIEPQLIGLMEINPDQVKSLAHRWLRKGLFSPDSLISSSVAMSLRPGYYSFWTFDGAVEIHWSCELAEGSGDYKQWFPTSGSTIRFFDDVLVPGSKLMQPREVMSLEPFDLKSLDTFKPECLAGWPAVLYDRSLSDAALIGRETVMKKIRPQLPGLIEVGREKRNINIGSSGWSGMTFKHILLPVWTGEYRFQGKTYRFLINGQTGKVTGEKSTDSVKVLLFILIGAALLLIFFMIYLLLGHPGLLF